MSASLIPQHEYRTAPRVMKRNSAGMGVRVVDPAWIAKREDELRREAELEPVRAARRANTPYVSTAKIQRKERPDLVIREMARAFALPEHILRTRDQDYINEALYQTAKALRYRCQQLTLKDIAQLLGYADGQSVCRLLRENDDHPIVQEQGGGDA